MRCTAPYSVGFKADGKTLAFSERDSSKEFAGFQVPCRKCISCRLEHARSRAVRCVHESLMHDENCFITLTYDDDHVGSGRLRRRDWETFFKRLRRKVDYPISVFGVGEYGEATKRPHWHACIFGWQPEDAVYKYTTDLQHKVWSSEFLNERWGQGECEFGSVTFESAGYCARYSAKKLVHGRDQDHDFQPIPVFSTRYATGKSFLENFHMDIFGYGYCTLPNGMRSGIPRYYEAWFKINHPDLWRRYVTQVKIPLMTKASVIKPWEVTRDYGLRALTRNEVRDVILRSKFNQLQSHLKL